jgi:hypothetical protein
MIPDFVIDQTHEEVTYFQKAKIGKIALEAKKLIFQISRKLSFRVSHSEVVGLVDIDSQKRSIYSRFCQET